jgi:hypothetical protein
MFSTVYRLPALPILLVNSIIFTILPVNLKPDKSSTLIVLHCVTRAWLVFSNLISIRLSVDEQFFSSIMTLILTLNAGPGLIVDP